MAQIPIDDKIIKALREKRDFFSDMCDEVMIEHILLEWLTLENTQSLDDWLKEFF